MIFRNVALGFFLSLALVLALLAVPVLLLAGYLLGAKRVARPARPRPDEDRAVYEGEFRVLDEKPLDEHR